MKIGFVGLGKLGLPVALAIENRGHSIIGTDPSKWVEKIITSRKLPYQEAGAQEALKSTRLEFTNIDRVIEESEIIFVPVQTPHKAEFEGTEPIPEKRSDFNYVFLKHAVAQICAVLRKIQSPRIVCIISTVLPGTMKRVITPIIRRHNVAHLFRLCYNPSFIAMGTAMEDFLNPEFVLLGHDNEDTGNAVKGFYSSIHSRNVVATSIENAELIKVLYNTFIGLKIIFANTAMEICHKTPGTNVDEITRALSLATKRIISPSYMHGGMGDAGGCHPRDNIALSWLARELCLSSDLFESIMRTREAQTQWLSQQIILHHRKSGLPIVLCGEAYKPHSNITTGSCALLLSHYLYERGYDHDIVDPFTRNNTISSSPSVFFISTRHLTWLDTVFPHGSIVIDPFRYLSPSNVTYIPIGIGKE